MSHFSKIVSLISFGLVEYSPHPKSRLYMGLSIFINVGGVGFYCENLYGIAVATFLVGGLSLIKSAYTKRDELVKGEIGKLKNMVNLEKKVEDLGNKELIKEWSVIMALYDVKEMGYRL